MFVPGVLSEASQFVLRTCQLFLPDGFILESFENLRGNRVLLLLGKSGYFAQGIFQQFSHKPSLAEGWRLSKKDGLDRRGWPPFWIRVSDRKFPPFRKERERMGHPAVGEIKLFHKDRTKGWGDPPSIGIECETLGQRPVAQEQREVAGLRE
jgi:hypothetical protein